MPQHAKLPLGKTALKIHETFGGFTLVELIVVITILAILATVGFLSLSGYSDDARTATVKANVRTVYSAILTESTTSGNSPRYYVDHGTGAALSGAVAYLEGAILILTGGQSGDPGTNYSAGNPRWDRLRMNGEKFRLASGFGTELPYAFSTDASAAYSTGELSVGAVDVFKVLANGRKRNVPFFQVAGIAPGTKTASVTGNLPLGAGIQGLLRNPNSQWSHDALIDGVQNYYPGCDTADITLPNGQRWSACNAGASKAWTWGVTLANCSNSLNDCSSDLRSVIGGYYQWWRNDDVSSTGSTTVRAPAGTLANTVGHAQFIIDGTVEPVLPDAPPRHDWISVQNGNLWGGSGTLADSGAFSDRSAPDKLFMRGPCAPWYHVPTRFEWWLAISSLQSGIKNERVAAQDDKVVATALKLPLAGRRLRSDALFRDQGLIGFYWSSSPTVCLPTDVDAATCALTNAEVTIFHPTKIIPSDDYGRAQGFSVRCVAD